jgi:hypothetical protein
MPAIICCMNALKSGISPGPPMGIPPIPPMPGMLPMLMGSAAAARVPGVGVRPGVGLAHPVLSAESLGWAAGLGWEVAVGLGAEPDSTFAVAALGADGSACGVSGGLEAGEDLRSPP